MKKILKFQCISILCIALPLVLSAKAPKSSNGQQPTTQDASTNIATKALATYDLDHDSMLDKWEMPAFKAADPTLAAAALTYDTDHDGVLNRTEIDAWVAAGGKPNGVVSNSSSSTSKKSKKSSK